MPNTSATGGYLLPTNVAAPDDQDLQVILQGLIVGCTGLDGTLVRPRWQPTMPAQPTPGTTWAAIGVMQELADPYGYTSPLKEANTKITLTLHWTIDALCSFYGPQGGRYANALTTALLVAQNREAIATQGLRYVGSGQTMRTAENINTQWIRRVDVPLQFRRAIDSDFSILSLLSVPGQIGTEAISQPFVI